MKIRRRSTRRNYIIIALCMVLALMGVGYSAFSSLLTINGTANVQTNWCVGFDNTKTSAFQITKGLSTGENPNGTMTYSGTACGSTLQPNSSLTASFHQPGDKIEYTLTIVNKSSVTAAIKSITINNDENVTSNWTHTDGNITYTVEMPAKTTLESNETTTMKVIMKFQNETAIGSGYTGESHSINVRINTEQDDGNGGFTPTASKFTGTIYRWNTTYVKNGDSIVAESGTKWCDIETSSGNQYDCFDTETECNTFLTENNYTETDTCQQKTGTFGGVGEYTTNPSTLNKTYYLKHDVVDDIITASYVCFVTDTEHCLQGGNSSYYAANKTLLQSQESWFTGQSGSCSFGDDRSSCSYSSLNAEAYSDGNVQVIVSRDNGCYVRSNGESNCS